MLSWIQNNTIVIEKEEMGVALEFSNVNFGLLIYPVYYSVFFADTISLIYDI